MVVDGVDIMSSPAELQATLGAEMVTAKEAHLADRDDDDKRTVAFDAMQRYADARRVWRLIGEASGTRTPGAHVENNVEEG